MHEYANELLEDYLLLGGRATFERNIVPSDFGLNYRNTGTFYREGDEQKYGVAIIKNCAVDSFENIWAEVETQTTNVFVFLDVSDVNKITYRMYKQKGLLDELSMFVSCEGYFLNVTPRQLLEISEPYTQYVKIGIIDIFGTQNSCFSFHLKNNT